MNSSHHDTNQDKMRTWKGSFPYAVEYKDHFETPLVAYQDIALLIDMLVLTTGTSKNIQENASRHWKRKRVESIVRSNLVLYDPYYCNGRTKTLLEQLGFTNVVHEKRDFYQDIQRGRVPNYDILVTNPPYSDQHKRRCLDYCIGNLVRKDVDKNVNCNDGTIGKSEQKPYDETPRFFACLMPNYVATKQYFRESIQGHEEDMLYLAPCADYHYDHPEGTGNDTSPFQSLWFCGVGRENVPAIQQAWNNFRDSCDPCHRSQLPHLLRSLDELEQLNVISVKKRPNPKQRRKIRKRLMRGLATNLHSTVQPADQGVSQNVRGKKKKMRL